MNPPSPEALAQIEDLVAADIAERQKRGLAKYGTTLRDAGLSRAELLQHAYEEALDLAIYLKTEIQREAKHCNTAEASNLESENAQLRIRLAQAQGTAAHYMDLAIESGYPLP